MRKFRIFVIVFWPVLAAWGQAPRIAQGGVVSAGLSSPVLRQVSSNSIVSIFGENFAPSGTARQVSTADLVDGRLPENLGGACAEFGGQRARLFYLSPSQLNIQVPTLAPTGPMPVQVIVNCGAANETKSNAEMVPAQAATPEFFYFVRNSNGRNPIAAIDPVTGGLIGLEGLIPGVRFTPAQPRQIVSLFATGFGRTDPSFAAGVLPDRPAPTVEKVVVTFDSFMGTMFPEVLYAGVAPGLAGLYQINVQIPDNAPDFDLIVRARVGNFSTPTGAYLTVRR